jgi:hypothetical protein
MATDSAWNGSSQGTAGDTAYTWLQIQHGMAVAKEPLEIQQTRGYRFSMEYCLMLMIRNMATTRNLEVV